MALVRIVAPATEPIDLATAKLHCRVDGSDEDSLITALIVAAREKAEHETGRALVTQTWELVNDDFLTACTLRKSPVQSVTSVKYLDAVTGIEQTLDPAEYLVDKDGEPGAVVPAFGKQFPSTYAVPNAVRIRYVCGYGAAAAVPQAIKQWMLLAIGTMYAQRETVMSGSNIAALPDGFWNGLLDPYRLREAC